MNEKFLLGVLCGYLLAIFVFWMSDCLAYRHMEEKKEIVQKIKLPKVHEESFFPYMVTATLEVPRSYLMVAGYEKRVAEELGERLNREVWKYAKITHDDSYLSDGYVFRAELRILVSESDTIKTIL